MRLLKENRAPLEGKRGRYVDEAYGVMTGLDPIGIRIAD